MKTRLLILTPSYPPSKDGVANAAALLAEGLAARGHEVAVGTVWHPERAPSAPGSNPVVQHFKLQGSPSWTDPLRGETNQLKRLVAEFRGDAVLCLGPDAAPTVLAMQTFAKVPAPKVLVSHGFPLHHKVPWHPKFPWGLGTWLSWQPFLWQLPWLLRRFDRLVFLSGQRDFGRFLDHRVAHLVARRRIQVIPNGVEWKIAPAHRPDFRRTNGLQDALLFLCVAYYCDLKNQLMALRAYRRARIPNSALVFIGAELNDYSLQMQQLDQQLAPAFPEGRVLLLEKLDRAPTEAAFAAMDAFVLASKTEAQPIVLLEAMAAGKPFISTDVGCVRELPGGLVVRDEAAMTRELQRLAANPKLRASLGDAGHREYLAKYRKDAVLNTYETLIEKLVAARSDGAQEPLETT
jgi:glycosyltransferase involved in cell wall biosynthesis